MPKLTRMSEEAKDFAALLHKQGFYLLSLEEIRQLIGARSPDTARKWVHDLPAREVNGRRKWLVSDVAQKITRRV